MSNNKDYRVCYHHFVTPDLRTVYPEQEPWLTYEEAVSRAKKERAKGDFVAWVIDRDGTGVDV